MTTALVPTDPELLAPVEHTPPGSMLASPYAFRNALDMANVLSRSQLVPPHFRGKPEDVLAGILLAESMGENPLTVLQNVHFVGGKPGFAATFLIALANKSTVFDGGLRFITSGQGVDLAVTCWSIIRATGERVERTVSLAMARADGWAKNSKYASLPEQMLSYRAATFLIRLYAPGILLGYRPTDELEDIAAARSSSPVYSDPEPASPLARASRAAPQPPRGSGEPVTRQGSSATAPGPEVVSDTSPPSGPSPGPGASPERDRLLAELRSYLSDHRAVLVEECAPLGLTLQGLKSASPEKLAALVDAMEVRLRADADRETPPEGGQP